MNNTWLIGRHMGSDGTRVVRAIIIVATRSPVSAAFQRQYYSIIIADRSCSWYTWSDCERQAYCYNVLRTFHNVSTELNASSLSHGLATFSKKLKRHTADCPLVNVIYQWTFKTRLVSKFIKYLKNKNIFCLITTLKFANCLI